MQDRSSATVKTILSYLCFVQENIPLPFVQCNHSPRKGRDWNLVSSRITLSATISRR